ncbi:hypothetical protein B0H19DRAFT_1072044 [Mycena capillaripes]|nr:hypothetical protein B0H19DRAFT_1072044 [Mycena capillaripes]
MNSPTPNSDDELPELLPGTRSPSPDSESTRCSSPEPPSNTVKSQRSPHICGSKSQPNTSGNVMNSPRPLSHVRVYLDIADVSSMSSDSVQEDSYLFGTFDTVHKDPQDSVLSATPKCGQRESYSDLPVAEEMKWFNGTSGSFPVNSAKTVQSSSHVHGCSFVFAAVRALSGLGTVRR